MIKKLREFRKSIQGKIFISFIIVLLLPSIIISVSTYYISLNILKGEIRSSFSKTGLYVKNNVYKELEQIKNISDYIFIDNDIKEAIQPLNKTPYEQVKAIERAEQILRKYSIANIFSNINVVKIYGLDGKRLSVDINETNVSFDDEKVRLSAQYKKALENNGSIVWQGIGKAYLNGNNNSKKNDISLFRVIKNSDYNINIGVMYISLRPEMFSQLVEKVYPNGKNNIYIIDNTNKFVNDLSDDLEAKGIKDVIIQNINDKKGDYIYIEKNNMIFNFYIEDFDWKVVGVIPIKELTRNNRFIFLATSIAFIVSFMASCIIWYFVSSSIVKPIKVLNRAMIKVREGNLLVKVNCLNEDEMGILSNNFNFMTERINNLFYEVLEKQANVKDAEYKALQAQINPHFVYNTLNTIRWMAIIQKVDNIKRMVDALGRLLRNSTSKMEQIITLDEEINNLKDYIYIQKIAYNNKFEVEWKIDEALLQYRCIKFILQPIVENAIFHGIEPKEYFGIISITIKRSSDNIIFLISDDGVGISQSDINMMLMSDDESKKRFSGIGISNVNQRIKMTYGEEYGISIESEKGSYTTVTVKIPMPI